MRRTTIIALSCLLLLLSFSGTGMCREGVSPGITRNYLVYDPRTKLAYNGFRIVYPAYEAIISVSEMWGYYSFELLMAGERVVYTRQFRAVDPGTAETVFSATEFHKPQSNEFQILEWPGEIQWKIAAGLKKEINYGGGIVFEPNRISLTDAWVWLADTNATAVPSVLELGVPLLTGCCFQARLFDGAAVSGTIPSNLPEKPTCFAGGTGNRSIREITFDTKKGKVKMTLLPDAYSDIADLDGLQLSTQLIKGRKPEERQYEFINRVPAGPKGLPRSYTVIFEFPEN